MKNYNALLNFQARNGANATKYEHAQSGRPNHFIPTASVVIIIGLYSTHLLLCSYPIQVNSWLHFLVAEVRPATEVRKSQSQRCGLNNSFFFLMSNLTCPILYCHLITISLSTLSC